MCGRFAVDELVAALARDLAAEALGWDEAPDALPNANLRPTDPIPVLVESARLGGRRVLAPARWGLLSPGSPERGAAPAFNARVETLGSRPTWREPLARMRCVVPATATYEWHGPAGARSPVLVRDPERALMPLAGVARWWRADERAPWRLTATIVTRSALGEIAEVHDRMPLVLPDGLVDEWLDGERIGDQAFADEIAAHAEPACRALAVRPIDAVPPSPGAAAAAQPRRVTP